MLKKTAIFFIILILLPTLISCSKNQEKNPSDSNNGGGDKSEIPSDAETLAVDSCSTDYLPKKDYGGSELTIITFEDSISGTNMFIAEEQIGEVLNDAIYRRNITVEDRFKIKIKGIGLPWAQTPSAVEKSVKAGDQAYDLLALHSIEACGVLLNKGLTYNWLDVPHINLDKPWYNQSIIDLLEINGYLPYIASDFNYGSYPFSFAMIFNKGFVQKYGIENPYELVKNGDWTLDKFCAVVKLFSEDVNGDGIFDINDLYGLATDNALHITNYTNAVGDLFVQKTADNNLELAFYNEKQINLSNKLYDLFFVGNHTFIYEFNQLCPIEMDQNRTFIQSLWLYDLPRMRGMDVEFGVIPFPKYDKQQKNYLTSVDARGTVLALPVNTEDTEKAGIIVEALSAESERYVVPAYYDIALKQKDIRDEESAEMLDIIFAGRVYDIGYMYDSGISRIMMQLILKKSPDLTSEYEKGAEKWQKFYDEIAEQYRAVSDKK